jgi:hypothetical protein
LPSDSTDDGITISVSPLTQNANSSIRTNFDSDSNVTDESDLQHQKQYSPSDSTDDGITRSVSPLSWNADASIRNNLDEFSKIIERNLAHFRKHFDGMNSIDEGIHRRISLKSFSTTTGMLAIIPFITILRRQKWESVS